MKKSRLSRTLRAQLRDARVLFQESRSSLVWFLLVVFGGAILLYLFYQDPSGGPITFGRMVHGVFTMIFFEVSLPFPQAQAWYLQALFFIIPILGLVVVADGLLRFGSALFNKQTRAQKWQVAMASTYSNHIIICGLGKVGYRTALELRKFERDVVGIEIDPDCRFVENVKALGIPVIIADARRRENLIKAGVEQADAIIPATNDELTNLDVALDASEANRGIKVVLRMFDPDLARRVEKGFGIHTVLSVSALAAPMFAAAAMRVDTKHSFYVGKTLLNVSEIVIKPSALLVGWSIEQMERRLDLSVVYYQSAHKEEMHPAATMQLCAGDKILVLASLVALQQLNALNRPAD